MTTTTTTPKTSTITIDPTTDGMIVDGAQTSEEIFFTLDGEQPDDADMNGVRLMARPGYVYKHWIDVADAAEYMGFESVHRVDIIDPQGHIAGEITFPAHTLRVYR